MAIQNTIDAFNPNTPDVGANNYIGWSKPVDSGKGISVAGEALKGASNLLDLGVKAADAGVKASIEQDVGDKVRAERDEYTKGLEGATQYMNTPPPGTPGASYDVPQNPLDLGAPEAPLPPELKALPQTLSAVSSGRSAGKISETYYYGKVSQIASDVRSRYPSAYRDYIDKEVSKITGVDPANAYIRGLVADLNASMTSKDKEHNAMLGDLRSNRDIPGAEKVYDDLLNHRTSVSKANEFLAYPKQEQYRLQMIKTQAEASNATDSVIKANRTYLANEIAASTMKVMFHSLEAFPEIDNPEKLQKLMMDVQSGKTKLDPKQSLDLAMMSEAWITRTKADIERQFTEVGKDGKTIRGVLGNDESNKIVDSAVAPMMRLRDAFHKGDLSTGAYITNLVAAAKSDTAGNFITNKDIGPHLLALDFVKNNGGGEYAANALINNGFNDGLPNAMKMQLNKMKMDLINPDDPRLQKGVTSFKSGVETLKKTQDAAGVAFPKSFDALTKLIDGEELSLTDPKTSAAVKANIIRSMFGPENRGALRLIAPDRIDERGNRTQGYQSLFYRYTSPDVVKEVMATKDPTLIAMYMDTVETAVTQDLFRKDISNLSSMSLDAPGNWKVSWDTSAKQFEFQSTNPDFKANFNRYTGRRETPQETTINSLNKGIRGLVNYAKGVGMEGDAIDAYVIDALRLGGLGLDRAAGIQGIPTKLADALKTAYTKQVEAEKKAAENRKKIQDRYTPGAND